MTNQFDAWVKGKVVVFPCGCETHHGNDPITGHIKICEAHWGAKEQTDLPGNPGTQPRPL